MSKVYFSKPPLVPGRLDGMKRWQATHDFIEELYSRKPMSDMSCSAYACPPPVEAPATFPLPPLPQPASPPSFVFEQPVPSDRLTDWMQSAPLADLLAERKHLYARLTLLQEAETRALLWKRAAMELEEYARGSADLLPLSWGERFRLARRNFEEAQQQEAQQLAERKP